MLLLTNSAQQFSFTDDSLSYSNARVFLETTLYTTGDGDKTDLDIYYKLCTEAVNATMCFFTEDESKGIGADVQRLDTQRFESKSGDQTQANVPTRIDYLAEL